MLEKIMQRQAQAGEDDQRRKNAAPQLREAEGVFVTDSRRRVDLLSLPRIGDGIGHGMFTREWKIRS